MKKRIGLAGLLASATFGVLGVHLVCPAHAADQILKVAYSSDYEPLTPEGGVLIYKTVISEFEKNNPGVKVDLIKIPGSYQDFLNKLGLMFRSKATTPDVVDISSYDMVLWTDSGYLADITNLVANSDAWKGMPDSVKSETTFEGKVYAISHGENDLALLYDKTLFQKAGIGIPWKPKTWNDVLDAARKVKAADPTAWPLWLPTGTAQGSSGAVYGPSNMLLGSSDPVIYDAANGKWVVDSKGIREVVSLYKTASEEGLLAPSSQLLNASAIATPPTVIPQHKLGVTLAGNWFSTQWLKQISAPYYPSAAQEVGFAPIPTMDGQAPGVASTATGWDFAISSSSSKKDIAWKFIEMCLEEKNLITFGLYVGQIPPVTAYAQDKAWTSLDPFSADFQRILPLAVGVPVKSGYTNWAMGFLTATEAVVLDPKVSVDDAVQKMNDYITNQAGPDAVEVRK
jgi:multiple sugar transport system substrate-binding protein